jgi:hypothetical protein
MPYEYDARMTPSLKETVMRDAEAPPPADNKRAERLQIMITDDELAALDDWRYLARMPSRSAAVRELIRRGLAAEGYFQQAGQKDQSSKFGILDKQ